jgi:DNA-binding IclR family transcriptional regulator
MAFPAHLTSGGPVMLADLPRAELDELYAESRWADRLEQRPSMPALRRQLALVRDRGFAINDERTEKGLVALGRPVRPPGERAQAALSISMPAARFSRSRLPHLIRELTAATAAIDSDLARGAGSPS